MERRAALALACLLALTACSGKQDDTAAKTAAPPSGTINVPKNNVFSPLVQDLNKAKQVNNQVQQQAQDANKTMESDSAPAAATNSPN